MPPKRFESTGVKFHKVNDLVTEVGIEEAKALLGWREPKGKQGEGKVIRFPGVSGKTEEVIFANNNRNRPFSLPLAKRYGEQMLRQEWAGQKGSASRTANGETWVIDKKGKIVSCAHRAGGVIYAEHKRQKLLAMGKEEELRKIGANPRKPVTVPAIVVVDVDDASADTADLGRKRNLADILFRRDEMGGKELKDATKAKLSKNLDHTIRLVWLRTNGNRVARGPHLPNPEGLDFLEQHPLLHEAVWHIHEVDGGGGAEGKKISNYVSPGYAAGMLYLFAFGTEDLSAGVDFTKKPAQWDEACKFWTLFAEDLHDSSNPIKSLHKVLEDNRVSEEKPISRDRDVLCTVIIRAWLAWTGQTENWRTARALVSKLYEKDGDREVLNLERIGGIDFDREALSALGLTEPDLEERKKVGNWKIGDTAWINQGDVEPWFGKILAFSDDGLQAVCREKDTEDEYAVDVAWLCGDKPEWNDDVEEAESAADEAESAEEDDVIVADG